MEPCSRTWTKNSGVGGAGEGDGLGLGLGEGDRRSLISRITPMTFRKAMVSVAGRHRRGKQARMSGKHGVAHRTSSSLQAAAIAGPLSSPSGKGGWHQLHSRRERVRMGCCLEKPSWPSPAATGPVQAYLQADARVSRHVNAKVANPMHCCMAAGTSASGTVHTAG